MRVALLPVWTITLVDGTGSSTVAHGTLKPGLSTAEYLTGIEGLAARMMALSGCVSVRCAVTYRVKESAAFAPRRTDHILTLAQWAFTVPSNPSFVSFETPASTDQTVADGCFAGIEIDTGRSEVAAFITAVETGLFCDPFGADIGLFCSAHLAIGA